ncbi:MAG: ABC transporter ATP-binding protein [Pseudomonadota bacterium]
MPSNGKKQSFATDLRFVAAFFRPHIRLVIAAVLCMALFALTTSAYAYLIGPALKVLLTSFGSGSGPGSDPGMAFNLLERAAQKLQLSPIVSLVIAVISLALIRSAAQVCEAVLSGKAGQNVQMDVRYAMFHRLLSARPLSMLKVEKGDAVSKLVADVSMMGMAIAHALTSVIRDSLQIICLAGLAVYLNQLLSLLALVVLPAGLGVVYFFSGRIRDAYRDAMNRRGKIASMFVESTRGLAAIKMFLAENQQLGRLQNVNRGLMKSIMKAIYLAASPAPVIEILATCGVGALLLYVTYVSPSHMEKPERLISFFAAVFLLYRPIKNLGSMAAFLQHGLAATRRISSFLEMEQEPPGGDKDAPALETGVRLEDVRFSYDDREILAGLSLDIPRGKITSIVGASGEGKTTLVYLLCGLLHPKKGRVLWNGLDARDFKTRSLRERIALVSQDPFLMNAIVEENILLGQNEEHRGELERIVEAAGLGRLLSRTGKGLQANVEEEASSLSTGERQRICIARAMLKPGDLIVFDEAASSLDSRSEDAIHASLKKLKGERTVVVVSHRLSAVKVADRIAVMAEGRVVEEGNYRELSRPGTAFHDLFSSQIAKESPPSGRG